VLINVFTGNTTKDAVVPAVNAEEENEKEETQLPPPPKTGSDALPSSISIHVDDLNEPGYDTEKELTASSCFPNNSYLNSISVHRFIVSSSCQLRPLILIYVEGVLIYDLNQDGRIPSVG